MKTPFITCTARIFDDGLWFTFARNRLHVFLVLIVLSGAVVLSALLPHARAKLIGGATSRNRTEKSVAKVKLSNDAFDLVDATDTALNVARKGHAATLLSDGKVLIVGGENQNGFVAEVEIFDPATGIFSFSGKLNIARADHTATPLPDGRILIAGGRSEFGVLNNTEIFDPSNGVFSTGPNLVVPRTGESATLISDGRIVFAGGDDSGSVEIYNPSPNTFTLLPEHMTPPRSFHGAASLNDGRILFVGGVAAEGSGTRSGEILNIATDTFESVVNSLTDEHLRPILHVLPDGKVQIIGGSDHEVMEIYDTATNQFGAHAHLYPNGDDHAELARQLLAARSRAALFRLGSANALTNRVGHAITELAGCNHALITGGVDPSGAILNTAAVVSSSRATITTDKLDYSPGTPVIVTGTGWQPLEFVTVIFHEDPHVDTENPHMFIVQADAHGNFTNEQYAPEAADKGVTYILAAEGASSLRTAQTTFTDASPGSLGNYATTGLSGTTAPGVVAPSNVAANITFSNLSRGSGLTALAATDAFNSSSWPTTSLTVAGNTDYYEFTITPNPSYRFSASELRVGLQRSSSGPASVELRSSLDSFGSTIGSVISVGTSLAKFTVNLSAVPGLQNRASAVIFRLYGYNAGSSGGTLRIQQILSPAMVGLEVDGVVTSAGSLQLSSSTYTDNETNVDHAFNIPVTRTGGSGGAVSVNYSVTDGTATTGDGDYAISPAFGTLHWADGDSSSKNIAITVKGDAKYEADETINVSISSPDGGATLGSPANAVVTITNDDAQPSLSVDDVTQSEGNSGTTAFIFTVSKTGSTAFDLVVDYATQDGTTPLFAATSADNDYLATSGSLTIGANETTRTITIAVQGDTHIENDETFFINLSNATGATIAHSQGVGTIQNDDALIAIDDNYNTEEDTPLNIAASGILNNDSDSGLTAVLVSSPSHAASFNLNDDGSFNYTPAANYNGTDHFTYKAKNLANVESNVATVTLTITPVNDAPLAVDDSATIDEDTPKNLTQADLKSNDTDIDNTNAQLFVTAVSSPLNGTVVLNGEGTVTFAPAPNFNGIAGFDYTVSDGNLTDAGHVTITVTPINDAPVITSVTPVSQSKQYSDPINAVTINATDVDSASLSISITNLPAGINASGGCTAAGVGTTCSWTLTGNLAAAPNTYIVGIKTSDGASCDNSTATITVLKEDARAYYSGAVFASTACPTCGAAAVTLSATIKDVTAETGDPLYDSFAGDIRNATVTFVNRDNNTPIATVAVGLANGGDTKVGTATYNWLLNIGSADSLEVTIGIIVNNYYTRNSSDDNSVIEVAKPLNNFITGGGVLSLSNSAGLKAGEPGTKNNFGFNVKYNSSGRNLQGNINTIIRRLEGGVMHVYQVKGNSMTSLSVNLNITASHPFPTATFNGKASINDITNPESPVSVDGNATLQVTMADRGEPGGADTIAITVWNKAGGLWFASHWNGITTLEKTLAGGNLIVH